jgi:glycosyltransferase involved in cell wall biosynthesis
VFCLPSDQESFSLATVEAMTAGLPVVISDQVNICHEIHSARAGLVVPRQSEAVCSALFKLLADDHLRKQMGENGRRLVEEQYDWNTIVGSVIDLYQQAAQASRPRPVRH